MSKIIYRAFVERLNDDVDSDRCPCQTWDTYFDELFATKRGAIRHAKERFDKQPLNDFVHAKASKVLRMIIGANGKEQTDIVFRQFQNEED